MLKDNNAQVVNNQSKIKKLKQKLAIKKNNILYGQDFSKFDTETGEKIAGVNNRLAEMEAVDMAHSKREAPLNKEELAKDVGTGASLATIGAHTLLGNGRMRAKGAIGLAAGIGAGVLSLTKQKSQYNKQQAARETLVGKDTTRANAYKQYLANKYHLNKEK